MALITVAGVFVYRNLVNRAIKADPSGNTFYNYHFALVVESHEDPFWENVWSAAKEEAAVNDAYVEWIGRSLTEQYPLTMLMEMAIAAQVDGIMIQPDGSEEIQLLIQKAIDNGIPVITVMSDAPNSNRQGYVGYNNYELGQLYGQQLLASLPASPADYHAVVLFSNDVSENAQSIVYSSIVENLEGRSITVDVMEIDNSNVFSAEEAIRELIAAPATSDTAEDRRMPAPDILVCLNATNTICAYQAVVDQNKVGEVQILGYYDSDEILTAVEKRIIQAIVAVDAGRVGSASVGALTEYLEYKRTSDFTPVGLTVVTSYNLAEYRGDADAAEGEE